MKAFADSFSAALVDMRVKLLREDGKREAAREDLQQRRLTYRQRKISSSSCVG